jgi:16S rRNA processing protein RimM
VNFFAVGKIVGCFGIKGYVKVRSSTHSAQRFKTLRQIYLGISPENTVPDIIDEVFTDRHPVVMKFRSIPDRSSAERVIGQYIFIEERDLELPASGSYFIHDIIGCEIWSKKNEYVGTLEDVYKLPAQDVWVIRNENKRFLIPAVKDFIKSVDAKGRKIVIDVIEGLIEE